jgi:hypothetical protein
VAPMNEFVQLQMRDALGQAFRDRHAGHAHGS